MTTRMPSARSAVSAPTALSLIGSATATSPARGHRSATSTRSPLPAQRFGAIRQIPGERYRAPRRAPDCRPRRARPSTVPVTPLPVSRWKSATVPSARPRASAPVRSRAASGCSLPRSSVAARRRRSSSAMPPRGTTPTRRGLPSVNVPVLSTTSVSTFSMSSSAWAFSTRIPARAPRPVPTMIDIGVARPSAQGRR